MAVKIKLKRIGKMREPHYRIVVADARTKRSGRAIEEIGQYHPRENPSRISVESDRAQYWLGVGAQPTEAVAAILRVTGDWQKFKGEPAPPPMLMAEPKADKRSIFAEAAKEAAGLSEKAATTPKARKAAVKKPAAAKAEESVKADDAAKSDGAANVEEPAKADDAAKADETAQAADEPAAAPTTEAPAAPANAEAATTES